MHGASSSVETTFLLIGNDPEPPADSAYMEGLPGNLEPHLQEVHKDATVAPRVSASICLHQLASVAKGQDALHSASDRQAAGKRHRQCCCAFEWFCPHSPFCAPWCTFFRLAEAPCFCCSMLSPVWTCCCIAIHALRWPPAVKAANAVAPSCHNISC